MSANLATGLQWLGVYVLTLVVCAFLRSKVAALLATALCAPPAFYLALLLVLGDVQEVRDFARDQRTSLITQGIQIAILVWATYLAVRLARAKAGSRVTWWGRRLLPGPREVEDAYIVLTRVEAHGIKTEVTRKWAEEDYAIRKAMRFFDQERDGKLGLRARLILHLLQPTIYRRMTARYAQRHIHIDHAPDTAHEDE